MIDMKRKGREFACLYHLLRLQISAKLFYRETHPNYVRFIGECFRRGHFEFRGRVMETFAVTATVRDCWLRFSFLRSADFAKNAACPARALCSRPEADNAVTAMSRSDIQQPRPEHRLFSTLNSDKPLCSGISWSVSLHKKREPS